MLNTQTVPLPSSSGEVPVETIVACSNPWVVESMETKSSRGFSRLLCCIARPSTSGEGPSASSSSVDREKALSDLINSIREDAQNVNLDAVIDKLSNVLEAMTRSESQKSKESEPKAEIILSQESESQISKKSGEELISKVSQNKPEKTSNKLLLITSDGLSRLKDLLLEGVNGTCSLDMPYLKSVKGLWFSDQACNIPVTKLNSMHNSLRVFGHKMHSSLRVFGHKNATRGVFRKSGQCEAIFHQLLVYKGESPHFPFKWAWLKELRFLSYRPQNLEFLHEVLLSVCGRGATTFPGWILCDSWRNYSHSFRGRKVHHKCWPMSSTWYLLGPKGLTNLIVQTEDEYVSKALELASNIPLLSYLRTCLWERMLKSKLSDGHNFVHGLE